MLPVSTRHSSSPCFSPTAISISSSSAPSVVICLFLDSGLSGGVNTSSSIRGEGQADSRGPSSGTLWSWLAAGASVARETL